LEKKIKSRVAGSFSNFYVMRTKKLSLYGLTEFRIKDKNLLQIHQIQIITINKETTRELGNNSSIYNEDIKQGCDRHKNKSNVVKVDDQV
jgi:hypothetical protein